MALWRSSRPRSRLRHVALFPVRVLYKTLLFLLTVFILAPAQALQMTPKIERPEKKNRIVQVDKRK